MQRFFIENFPLENKDFVYEDKDFVNQIVKVLRFKQGQEIILFNSKDDFDYIYIISKIEKKKILLTKKDKIKKEKLGKKQINIFQALPNKISKIELILQKGVEVGLNNFYFFSAKRSQNFFISDNKKKRFEKIVIEAVEQSGQNKIPKIIFGEFDDFIKEIKTHKNLNLFFHTKQENCKKISDLEIKNFGKINFFVGPEGGFCKEEIENFLKNNFIGVNLGKNILRTETTGIVVGFYLNNIKICG